jgi:hypothetical protein
MKTSDLKDGTLEPYLYAEKLPFTPEQIKRFIDCLKMGNYIETASAYAGISSQTLYRHLKLGQNPGTPQSKLLKDVQTALAESENRDLTTIAAAAKSQWQAAAWRLERRWPERWGRFDRLLATVQAEKQNPAPQERTVDLSSLTDEELREYRRLQAKVTPTVESVIEGTCVEQLPAHVGD